MAAHGTTAFVVGTLDTKWEEIGYVADCIRADGVAVRTVDVSTRPHGNAADISAAEVAAFHPERPDFVGSEDDRGTAVGLMSEALGRFLAAREDIGGVIGLGGSNNTTLVAGAMQRLPIGLPKLMVSTVASGDVSRYVGPSDITMMYSITDVAGLNRISRVVLANAAHALAGMIRNAPPRPADDRPAVGLTMYGVTTPCVTAVRRALEDRYDPLIFHAIGVGGRSFEKLIDEGAIDRVIDVTTTEIADEVVGGLYGAGPDRLGAVIRRGIPWVGSVGGLDIVTFGPPETVPARFRDRTIHVHNANFTLVRANVADARAIGEWLAERLNRMTAPWRLLLPEGGLSVLDTPGSPFHDGAANQALFSALEVNARQDADRRILRRPEAINDPAFAAALVTAFEEVSP